MNRNKDAGFNQVPRLDITRSRFKLKFDNDVDKFVASFGTIDWAKNLGIYQEEPPKEPKKEEATE